MCRTAYEPGLIPHQLLHGTKVEKIYNPSEENKVTAGVWCTEFRTVKGNLIRDLLLSKGASFHYMGDFIRFIAIMSIPACIGFGMTLYFLIKNGTSADHVIIRALNITSVVVPPDLPVALAGTVIFSAFLLRRASIYCIELPSVSLCGRISVFCFDKTGTITEANLVVERADHVVENFTEKNLEASGITVRLTEAMRLCHSLLDTGNELKGDPLEEAIVEYANHVKTEFTMTNNQSQNSKQKDKIPLEKYEIIKTFPFQSEFSRMSVLVQSERLMVICKGAPEKLIDLCDPKSIPQDLLMNLEDSAKRGYRIIAYGIKPLKDSEIEVQREDAEKDLCFIGYVLLKNSIKKVSKSVLTELKDANIRRVMITGDHLLTALHVAKDCGMITKEACLLKLENEHVSYDESDGSELGLTGDVFDWLKNNDSFAYQRVLLYGVVFARMSPQQKAQLVNDLRNLDYCVGMCGDGANDCGALKCADVGVSLSEAEASVASPFTSQVQDISCCSKLIKQGRACLSNTATMFLFVIMAAFLFSTTLLLLFSVNSSISDLQSVFNYFMQVVPLIIAQLCSKANEKISKKKPSLRLFRSNLVITMLFIIFVHTGMIIFYYFLPRMYDWYKSPSDFDNEGYLDIVCYESTTMFHHLTLSTILIPIFIHPGQPYLQPLYKNWILVLMVTLSLIFAIINVVSPWEQVKEFLSIVSYPEYGVKLIVILINFIGNLLCYFTIYIGMKTKYLKRILRRLKNKKSSHKAYKRILAENRETAEDVLLTKC